MLDLPLWLGVLKAQGHAGPREDIFLQKKNYDGFLLMYAILKFEGVLFRGDSRNNDRVDCLCRTTGSTSFRAQVRGLIT